MTPNKIIKIEIELQRFTTRLNALKNRMAIDEYALYGCKESGAFKRAALDLKSELSNL